MSELNPDGLPLGGPDTDPGFAEDPDGDLTPDDGQAPGEDGAPPAPAGDVQDDGA